MSTSVTLSGQTGQCMSPSRLSPCWSDWTRLWHICKK